MITLSKLAPAVAGVAPIVVLSDGKPKARMTTVTSEHARAGWAATFIEDEWLKVVHYTGTEEEARAQAQADLARLTEPDPARRCYFGRRLDAYYWSVR